MISCRQKHSRFVADRRSKRSSVHSYGRSETKITRAAAGGSIKVLYYWMRDEQGEGDVL